MEREAIFNLEVKTGNSAKNLANTEKELKKLRDNIKNSGNDTKSLEANLKALDAATDNSNLSFRDLNKVIQDYQTIALKAGRESPIGMQALERASQLRDEQLKLTASTNKLADDGRNLAAAMSIGQGVLAGYTAFQGVTAMLGVENEALLETITKLQGAQSTLVSIQQIDKLLQADSIVLLRAKAAMMQANNIVTATGTKILKLFNIQVVANNTALGITNVLLQALGIGLIIAAIALLVNYWEDLTKIVTDSVKAIANFIGIRDEGFEQEKQQAAERQAMIEKDMEGIKDRLSEEEKALDRKIALMKAEGKETQALENQKIKIRISANEAQKNLLKEEALIIENRRKINGELSEEDAARLEEIKKSYTDLIRANKSLNNQIEVNEIEAENKRKERQEKAEQEAAAKAQKRREQRLKEQQEAEAEAKRQAELELEMQRLLEDLKLQGMQEGEEKRREQIRLNQEREMADLVAKYGKDTELIKQLEANQIKELEDFENQIKLEKAEREAEEALLKMENDLLQMEADFNTMLNKELELEAYRRDMLLQNENLTDEERRRIQLDYEKFEKDVNQRRIDNEEKVQATKIQMSKDALSIISNLAELFAGDNEARQKKAFEINKAASASVAAIDTAAAVVSALKSDGIGPARYLAAAAAGAAGALQIKKIMSTKFQASQPPTDDVPEPPTSASAEQQTQILQGIQDGGIRNDTSEMQDQAGSQQVYVLESDIRNVGNRVSAIETRSRVG